MLILMLKTKIPGNESFTYGTFVPENESSRVQKFQLTIQIQSKVTNNTDNILQLSWLTTHSYNYKHLSCKTLQDIK